MSTANVAVIISLTDKLTAPLRAVSDRVGSLAARMTRALDTRGMANVAAGSRRVASGLGDVIRQSRGAGLALAGYGAALSALSFKFIGPAAEMERFKVQLTNLEGGADGAKKAMSWIQDFATRTPLELNDTVAAYAKLKAFGLDPTNGSLQALVDTMAATGGGAEQLDGLVLALGQAWTKGKLQGEEALQMLERGVPVWDLLAEKMGKSGAEVQELATKGKLGRKELTLLIDALAERNKGASGNMAKTWGGIISNLMDHWSRFQIMVMDSGVFDYLKSRLQIFLALLDQMSADGRLQLWADKLAKAMLSTLQGIWRIGAAAVSLWRDWQPLIVRIVELMGGWEHAALAVIAIFSGNALLGIAGSLIGIVTGIGQVATGLWMISVKPLKTLGNAAIFAAKIGVRALIMGLSAVRIAFMAVGRAIMANPIGLAVAAIAGAAYLIYRNWDRVGPWFGRLFGNMIDISRGLIAFLKGVFTGDMSMVVSGLKSLWSGLSAFYRTLWDGICGIFRWAWDSVIRPVTDKLGLTEPLISAWNAVRAAFDVILNAIGSVFSFVWSSYIKPAIDGLFSVQGVGAVWEGIRDAISAVLDYLAAKFQAAWGLISPVIDGLKWAKDKGAEAVAAISGAGSEPYKGKVTDARGVSLAPPLVGTGITARAQGGTFTPGPLLVGERGAELRYESRGGFIAHHNALRGMIDMSSKARRLMAGAGLVASIATPVAAPEMPHPPVAPTVAPLGAMIVGLAGAVRADQGRPSAINGTPDFIPRPANEVGKSPQPINYSPVFNISFSGLGHNQNELRRLLRAELDAAGRKALSDMRRLHHD